jgi:hypothetical protein
MTTELHIALYRLRIFAPPCGSRWGSRQTFQAIALHTLVR